MSKGENAHRWSWTLLFDYMTNITKRERLRTTFYLNSLIDIDAGAYMDSCNHSYTGVVVRRCHPTSNYPALPHDDDE
jgi:hypothetical protein